jgi:formate hydrogenlyase subunit 3/multisubunit Na+/H+ antiporter MnhD subunit
MTSLPVALSLILIPGVPLLLAAAMALRTTRPGALALAPWAASPALLFALLGEAGSRLPLPWVMIGGELGLDATGQVFLLFTALLWLVAGVYARGYLAAGERVRFFVWFLLTMSGNLGLILGQDLTTFYLFFALMSFAAYGLVVHERNEAALRAGRVYILLVVVGELALFAALVLATQIAGDTAFAAVRPALAVAASRDAVLALALIGLGIKAGVLALHVWLPLAHPVAPTPASAVLSGAMIKAGLLGWLRLLPLGEAALPGWATAFILLGLAGAFYGVLVGLLQTDPKTLLAYSSISQMGTLMLAVGLALAAPDLWPTLLAAIGLYALHHGLAKGALFLGVGVVGPARGVVRLWYWLGLWVPALALAGAPLTSGMLAKTLLKAQAEIAPAPWDRLLPALLPWAALATSLLLGRFLVQMAHARGTRHGDQPAFGMVLPWVALLLAVALVPWWQTPVPPGLWSYHAMVAALWPILVAVALVLAALWVAARLPWPLPTVPPGDLLIPLGRMLVRLAQVARRFCEVDLVAAREALQGAVRGAAAAADPRRWAARVEGGLRAWPNALAVLLLAAVIAAALEAARR